MPGSVAEVEVLRFLLFEPELVVLRGFLEKVRGGFEHIVLVEEFAFTFGFFFLSGRLVEGMVTRRPRDAAAAAGRTRWWCRC